MTEPTGEPRAVVPPAARRLAAALLVLLSSACTRPAIHAPDPAPLVVATQVKVADDDLTGRALRYPGEVAPRYSTGLAFRVGGLIVERRVRLGDRVRRGQVLARLDATDATKSAEAARAALAAADHRLLYARQQLDRDQRESDRGLIAAAQLEQTQDTVAAAAAARQQATDNLTLAENMLRYQTLVADHDGLITAELADTGQVIGAGQGVYSLAWSGDLDVIVDVAARDVGRVSVGDRAEVRLSALDGPLGARVREIAPAADATSRTFRVRLQLDDPGSQLRLGMTGTVTLLPSLEPPLDPFVVPATALFHAGSSPALWVIRADSTLELRPVSVLRYRERLALVSGTLRPGERIVAAGVHTVHAGERVRATTGLQAELQADEQTDEQDTTAVALTPAPAPPASSARAQGAS